MPEPSSEETRNATKHAAPLRMAMKRRDRAASTRQVTAARRSEKIIASTKTVVGTILIAGGAVVLAWK